jgi:hypothetical protein
LKTGETTDHTDDTDQPDVSGLRQSRLLDEGGAAQSRWLLPATHWEQEPALDLTRKAVLKPPHSKRFATASRSFLRQRLECGGFSAAFVHASAQSPPPTLPDRQTPGVSPAEPEDLSDIKVESAAQKTVGLRRSSDQLLSPLKSVLSVSSVVLTEKVFEPRFRFAGEFPGFPPPDETHGLRMQRLVRKDEPLFLFRREPIFHKCQIQVLVAAVKFVADDRMAEVREMNADLVLAAGPRPDAQQGESGS